MQDIDEYQKESNAHRVYDPVKDYPIIYPALGLSGEVGEFHEKLKKIYRDKDGRMTAADRRELKLELGDVMWNVVVCAEVLGLKMSDVLEANLKKLASRRSRNKISGRGDSR